MSLNMWALAQQREIAELRRMNRELERALELAADNLETLSILLKLRATMEAQQAA